MYERPYLKQVKARIEEPRKFIQVIIGPRQVGNHMPNKETKTYSLTEMKDKHIGKVGTAERDAYEYELSMDVLGKMIKAAR